MIRGLYTAAAGMISEQRKHDTITNNIANLNTPGFKAGDAVSRSFPEMLIALAENGADGSRSVSPIGRMNTGVFAEEDVYSYQQGDLEETKNPFDFALVSNITKDLQGNDLPPFDGSGKAVLPNGQKVFQPQAFFTVQLPDGERRYTRNGKFTVNSAGEWITSDGYQVLGQDGKPLILTDPATGLAISDAKITPDGKLVDSVDGKPLTDANGQQLALLISRVENPNRLIREGNGVYRINPGEENLVTPLLSSDQTQVRQGFIERSNVDPTQSMVDLMTALRAYEANQKVIQYYDHILDKTVNEVGKV